MPEYSPQLAARFAEVAGNMVSNGLKDVEDHRVVAYISRLSMELSMKAVLERAGKPIDEIRPYSHRLGDLLAAVGECEIEKEITAGVKSWVRATDLRGITLDFHGHAGTLGQVIEAEALGASRYPGELRYGATPKDFPAEIIAAAAAALAHWVARNADSVRLRR